MKHQTFSMDINSIQNTVLRMHLALIKIRMGMAEIELSIDGFMEAFGVVIEEMDISNKKQQAINLLTAIQTHPDVFVQAVETYNRIESKVEDFKKSITRLSELFQKIHNEVDPAIQALGMSSDLIERKEALLSLFLEKEPTLKEALNVLEVENR